MVKKAKKTAPKASSKVKRNNNKATVAKSSDGTVQITFKFNWSDIEDQFNKAVDEHAKDVEIPGFRKGKAPREKIIAKLSSEHLVQDTLRGILPKAFSDALQENKIQPAMYPKFEVISANYKDDWSVRAITCEMPEIKLGNYKEAVKGAIGKASIVTPANKDKTLTQEEKEQLALDAVMKEAQVEIPNLLAQQEADAKLSQLLERIEKLGLTLDKYLESIKKTAEDIRADYINNARESIKMELILLQIAADEKLTVGEAEVDEFIKAAQGDPSLSNSLQSEEQKQIIRSILKKRKAIDQLLSYA
jgi:FKBP-type peptidyl-prolyl cis-trans isomerase (trigger factor)